MLNKLSVSLLNSLEYSENRFCYFLKIEFIIDQVKVSIPQNPSDIEKAMVQKAKELDKLPSHARSFGTYAENREPVVEENPMVDS